MKEKDFNELLDKLEIPENDIALNWVAKQNDETINAFTQSKRFQKTQQILLDSLNNQQNIALGAFYNNTVYNFWKDDHNHYGIWRRTSEYSYLTEKPEWETVLDIDRLNEEKNSNWSYAGANFLHPNFTRALIFFTDGGDACEIREFDLDKKVFVEDGFSLPKSKSSVDWIDENNLLLALDAGSNTVTESSYPRYIRRWARGTSPQHSPIIYAGEITDVAISARYDHTPGFEKILITRGLNFYNNQTYILTAENNLEFIDIPEDAFISFFKKWMLVKLTTNWDTSNNTYLAGSLLSINFIEFQQGLREFDILFTPQKNISLENYSFSRDYLFLNLIRDVVGIVEILKMEDEHWVSVQLIKLPDFVSASISSIDIKTNRYILASHGFLQNYRMVYKDMDNEELNILKQYPTYFDNSHFKVTQHFAKSKDSTLIPYFQVAAEDLQFSGKNPTLLYGYGGFEVSLTPEYLGTQGVTWLQQGGVYVIANIRGGGEYGSEWHQSAIKKYRYRAYEDFAAVANDLIQRKVTCSKLLAAQGGSNGGLLIGNMLTDYPSLFGALVCEVPLLDMIKFHLWLAGSSWIYEYGDPKIPNERQWLKSYSPFHKISPDKSYPPVLFTTGTKDDRVSPAHARKMVAKMKQQGHKNVWLYESLSSGHGIFLKNSKIAFYHAIMEEFIWKTLSDSNQ